MSGPPEPRPAPEYRYPDELTPEEQAELVRSEVVDAERYLDWLETGEGPDPCEELFD